MKTTYDYLKILKDEIHSTVCATIDENGLPQTRVIDIMLIDENSLYFITARGKDFYQQLVHQPYVAISGMCGGEGTMHKKALSVKGKVRDIGQRYLDQVFIENPYMAEIYTNEESRAAISVFQLYEGEGECFDLSVKPIWRAGFVIGQEGQERLTEIGQKGYYISNDCIGCGKCAKICPQQCIDSGLPFQINKGNCLHCGNCKRVCPVQAVKKR